VLHAMCRHTSFCYCGVFVRCGDALSGLVSGRRGAPRSLVYFEPMLCAKTVKLFLVCATAHERRLVLGLLQIVHGVVGVSLLGGSFCRH